MAVDDHAINSLKVWFDIEYEELKKEWKTNEYEELKKEWKTNEYEKLSNFPSFKTAYISRSFKCFN